MSTPVHRWTQESNRRSVCADCGLLARSKTSSADRRPYTEWSWRGNEWDSRSSPIPSCPPKHA